MAILGTILSRSGVILGSFWHPCGAVLVSFRLHFQVFLDHFWGPFFTDILRFLVEFWEVECNIKRNDAREDKSMQISVKIHENDAKLCKKKAFLRV